MIGIMALGSVHSGYRPLLADKAMWVGETGSPIDVDRPSDVAAGDQLLMFGAADGNSGGWASSDWTGETTGFGGGGSTYLSNYLARKIATGAEAATYSVTATNTNAKAGGVFAYRSGLFHSATSVVRATANNTLTIPGFTAKRGKLLFVHYYYNAAGALTVTPPAGFTLVPGASSSSGGTTFLNVYEKDVEAGATGDMSATTNGGSGILCGAYVVNLKGIDG